MNKLKKIVSLVLMGSALGFGVSYAASVLPVPQGGTGGATYN